MHACIHLIFLFFFLIFFFFKSIFNFTANWEEDTNISHKKKKRFLIYSLPPHLHNLPHYQHPYLIVVLICNSQMTYDMEHPFICFFAIYISSLVSCLLGSLVHFLFLLLYLTVLYTFWILILYQICLFFWKTNTIWYHLYVESKIWPKWICLRNRNR